MAYEAPQNGLSQPATELAFAAADTDSIALDSLSRSHSFPNFGAGLSLAGDTPTKMSPFSSLDNSSPASPVFETPTASATFKQPRSRAPSTSGGTFSSHAFDPSTQTSWPNAAAPMPTAINGTIHIDPTSTSHAMQLSHNVSGPPPPPVQSLPQTAPATSFDSQNYFDPRPGAMTLDRQASDPQNIFHQAQVFTSPSFVTSADTDMGSSRPVSQKSSRESFKEERARGAFTQLESLLAQVRPAVMDSQHATPLSPGQASLLDQAWKQFGDYFLQAAVISRPADGSEDQRTPDDSHDSGLSVKGERKVS